MARNLGVLTASLGFLLAASAGQAFPILMDQIGPDPTFTAATGNVYASQDFEPANDAFDIAAIDDFTVPAGPAQQLSTVEAVIGGFGTPSTWPVGTTAFRVEVYTSIASAGASLTGNAGSCTLPFASATLLPWGVVATQNRQLVTLNVTSCNISLAGGTQFWLGVIPVQNFGGNGQTGIAQRLDAGATPGGLNAFQANPGGGFGFGPTNQIDSDAAAGVQGTNLAYRLTTVPEPASIGMLAIGVAGLLFRRRRA